MKIRKILNKNLENFIKYIKHPKNGWSGYTREEAFQIEIECYKRLAQFPNFPKLISYDESTLYMEIEHCGKSLDVLKDEISLIDGIPNLEKQLGNIWNALSMAGISHLDIQLKNFTLKNEILYLIDFDIAILDNIIKTEELKKLFNNTSYNLGRLINDGGEHDTIVYLHTKEYFIFYFKNLLNTNTNRFIQNEPYQIIDNKGGWRKCDERWEYIQKYISIDDGSLAIDIGSAEGVFSKLIQNKTNGIVYSIEGSDCPYKRQLKYCNEEIKSGKIQLLNFNLQKSNVNFILDKKYKYTLFLSVLHWIDDPDYVLNKLSEVSEYMFIEVPSLNDVVTLNRGYMHHIATKYGDIDKYLKEVTGKIILLKIDVPAHTSKTRTLYVMYS